MKKIPFKISRYGGCLTPCPFKQTLPYDWAKTSNTIISVGGYYCSCICKYKIKIYWIPNGKYVICNYDNFKTKIKFVKELLK